MTLVFGGLGLTLGQAQVRFIPQNGEVQDEIGIYYSFREHSSRLMSKW